MRACGWDRRRRTAPDTIDVAAHVQCACSHALLVPAAASAARCSAVTKLPSCRCKVAARGQHGGGLGGSSSAHMHAHRGPAVGSRDRSSLHCFRSGQPPSRDSRSSDHAHYGEFAIRRRGACMHAVRCHVLLCHACNAHAMCLNLVSLSCRTCIVLHETDTKFSTLIRYQFRRISVNSKYTFYGTFHI